MTIRSLAWVINMAPAVEARARIWYSAPRTPSRRSQSWATRAASAVQTAMTAVATTEKPSSTTAWATVVVAPPLSSSCHWKKATTTTASDAATATLVETTWGTERRHMAEAMSSTSEAPKKISTGRITR